MDMYVIVCPIRGTAYTSLSYSIPSLSLHSIPADTAIHYDAKTIEVLLDREQEGNSVEITGSENLLANEYLSSFKVASYVTMEVADNVSPSHLSDIFINKPYCRRSLRLKF